MTTFHVLNELQPNAEQSRALGEDIAADPTNGPIFVVNLLKFRATPDYHSGQSPTGIATGRDAFYRYLKEAQSALDAVDGELVYAGNITALRIGETESLWDEIAILKYPSAAKWAEMLARPDWQAANEHRVAGLEGQLNIETVASTSPLHAKAIVK